MSIDSRRQFVRDLRPTWEQATLDQFLSASAERYAERPLVITDEITLTYADVQQQAIVIADALVALGVRPGDRVGMLMANYPEFVPFKFAIARAGAVAIPFNYLYRQEELGYVLAQSECSVLLTMSTFMQIDYLEMLDNIAPGWDNPDYFAREHDPREGFPHMLRRVVVHSTDGRMRPGATSYQDLLSVGETWPHGSADRTRQADDIADILYTSGSTGSPKGVLVTHDAVQRTAYASALTRAYEDGRRILFSLPCYHMFGYVEGLLAAMMVGGSVVLQTQFSAEGYLAGIERHRATDILCVPTMAVAMVENANLSKYDLTSLNAILCGSAPAPVWLWEQVEREFGVSEIVTGYGMTECGGAMTLTLPEDPLELTSTTVGRPKLAGSAGIAGLDSLCIYSTIDPETAEPLEAGAVGELRSCGPTTMTGFWNKPGETSAALSDDGWLRSGDLGFVRPDGYLALTGRSKELYKSGGELVMPKEVEDVIGRLDAVSQVFAVGLVDERWGEIGCAVIVPSGDRAVSADDVLDHCRHNLARFKVPKRVVFVEAEQLPTTPTGKIQKYRLIELITSGQLI